MRTANGWRPSTAPGAPCSRAPRPTTSMGSMCSWRRTWPKPSRWRLRIPTTRWATACSSKCWSGARAARCGWKAPRSRSWKRWRAAAAPAASPRGARMTASPGHPIREEEPATMAGKIAIMETVLRDAHQCLVATRMRTEDMLPIAAELDDIGYWSLETWGGATFDATLRFLHEDPWERLRKLRAVMPKTRFQMLLRGQNLVGYRNYPDDVVRAFVTHAAANGIDVFRIFDAMNDVRNMRTGIEAALKAGKLVEGTVCYTISPVHSPDYFLRVAEKLAETGVQ